MKKIFLSLTILSSVFFVSCEKETEEWETKTFDDEVKDGYWDYVCDTEVKLVPYEVCDSVWVETHDSSETEEYVCDTIVVGYDSTGNAIQEIECGIVLSSGWGSASGYWTTSCETKYDWKEVEVCDSVWVSTETGETDSTWTGGGGTEEEIDSSGTEEWAVDSVWRGGDTLWIAD